MNIASIRKFITAYPERTAFLICLIILAVVWLIYKFSSSEDPEIQRAQEAVSQISPILDTNPPPPLPPVEYLKRIKSIWEDIAPGTEGQGWLMYRQPVISVRFEKKPGPIQLKPNLPPVAKGAEKADEPDRILLKWDKNKDTIASIKSFRIYRRAPGTKNFALLIELSTSVISQTEGGYTYWDKGLQPETEYFYYVTAYSDDKDADKKESDQSGQMNATTPKDYKISFKPPETNAQGDLVVITTVVKYVNGQWETPPFYVLKKGEKIGKDKYFTGCTLTDIEPAEFPLQYPNGPTIIIKGFKIYYIDKNKIEYIIDLK